MSDPAKDHHPGVTTAVPRIYTAWGSSPAHCLLSVCLDISKVSCAVSDEAKIAQRPSVSLLRTLLPWVPSHSLSVAPHPTPPHPSDLLPRTVPCPGRPTPVLLAHNTRTTHS